MDKRERLYIGSSVFFQEVDFFLNCNSENGVTTFLLPVVNIENWLRIELFNWLSDWENEKWQEQKSLWLNLSHLSNHRYKKKKKSRKLKPVTHLHIQENTQWMSCQINNEFKKRKKFFLYIWIPLVFKLEK